MQHIKPTKLAKYGTLITCGVLLLIGTGTWFVKYPETVSVRAKLVGSNAPKPIVAKQNARVIVLNFKNGDKVTKGAIIGSLETTADINEVLKLSACTDRLFVALQQQKVAAIKEEMANTFNHLGELQNAYQALIQAYIPYRDYVAGNYVNQKKQLLAKDLDIAHRSRSVISEQQSLNKEDLSLSQTTLDKNKQLLKDKIISEEEYRNLSSQHIGKRMSEPQTKAGYISNEAQTNGIQKELVEIDNQVATQKALFQQAVFQLKSQIDDWKNNFLFVATENGVLNFTSFLQANQLVKAGNVLAYIIPGHNEIYAETLVPQGNFGKVAKGQKVLLKLDAYPWQEYGTLIGTVDYIGAVPVDSGFYLARITLPQDLSTNYKKQIPFQEGLLAQSEIITRDMRLTERFYYDLLKQLKK